MILHYYVDVSGKESTPGERAITAAGYIASESRWKQLETVWAATLKEAGTDYFHATEFFSCSGPFRGLRNDRARHQHLATLFALAAYELLPYGFSSSLDLNHFAPIFAKACPRASFRISAIPRYTSINSMLVTGMVARTPPGARTPFTVTTGVAPDVHRVNVIASAPCSPLP